MQADHFKKAAILAVILVIVFTGIWEGYWRYRGFSPTFNDDAALWALHRKDVYKPADKSTVVIGSSRIKFDLDIATWKALTGEDVVQLSMVGTSPRLLLDDLANDNEFKGKLLIDVTEPLFFSVFPFHEKSAKEGIGFYNKLTPSQKFSSLINHAIESKLVLLEEGKFGLNALFTDLEIPNRKTVFSEPPFPKEFGLTMASRQDYMLPLFLTDSGLMNRQTAIWAGFGVTDTTHLGVSGDILRKIFGEVKNSIDKIKARGGQVIFVRTPASGAFEYTTKITHPRTKYWNELLVYCNVNGIHYEDNPLTAGFICPEWSHLSSADAILYTKALVKDLQNKNWFGKNN